MKTSLSHYILTAIAAGTISHMAVAAPVRIVVLDSQTREPLELAAVAISNNNSGNIGALTDAAGAITTDLSNGSWTVNVQAVGYKPLRYKLALKAGSPDSYTLMMQPHDPIGEVVVTAREGRHASSSSLIDSTAMQHLQPSSFTDLLELLPGNVSKDPSMGSPNVINLRTASNVTATDDYMTSAIGTSFVVDGVPMNNNAGMQTTIDSNHSGHATAAKGVDMRAIGTDDIEKVEIIRGIASVEYGELTSGLVNIKRKTGVTRLEARFKADTKSQLFYVGKGFAMPGRDWIMNVGVSYLDAKIDPRNTRENYKRITGSVRSNKRFNNTVLNTEWNSSLNYNATFERDNNDPDLTVNNTIDRFSTTNHSWSWNNTVTIKPVEIKAWREASLTAGVSYSRERLSQEKHVSSTRIMPMPVSLTPGPNYVGYLPLLYLAHLDVEGDPFTTYIKGATTLRFTGSRITSTLKAGIEWNMSKNYGRGNVYDIERPITASPSVRPRSFNDIPAMHQLSAYIESSNMIHAGAHTIEATIGLRETQLAHLDSRYALSWHPYLDPRATVNWTLPALFAANHPVVFEVNGGIGLQTKMPVSSFLYPDLRYSDFEQINYYHNNPDFRTMNVMTYVEDLTNYDLLAARNLKWEVRGDISYRDNRLSVTYFRESMNNGFRHTGNVHRYTYNRYDATGYDPYATGHAPTIDELPYTEVAYQAVRSTVTNGSSTRKEGVEYTFQSRRLPVINTRLTVSGAYMHTTNNNSQPLWYKPSIVINGRDLQYVGLYDDTDGSDYKSFNTNFMFDTDLPKLGLRFSVSVQNMWFTSRHTLWRDGVPTHYMDQDGDVHPYTADGLNDPYLKQLVRTFSSAAFDIYTVPVETAFNIKATKAFWNNRINIAMYVNRLFTIQPDYKQNGLTVRRYSSPYFGMEINFKI
ncbi:MAG: TonB-dependent receptor [Muribaculaceae bacterium]|nr:TonB-dependent receptor [Muribaculaceae bacterium]